MSGGRCNPFPGLRPFRIGEKFLFFGREDQTRELLQRLRDHRFLAVVGTSGSGKSSLVQAGLLPQLYGGTMLEAGFQWEVAVMRPGGDPLTHLAEALVAADLYDPGRDASILETRATLSRSGRGLVEAVRQSDIEEGSNLLVVVDQFEEIFRFRRSGTTHMEEAGAFVKLLLQASQQDEIPIYIALTMRSDYLGDCSEFSGLAEAVNEGEYLIPRLSRDQRRRAIAGPVKVGGGEISPRLLQMLLNDVGDNPDHLPVLQHALMRTWDQWERGHEEGEPIDLRHYESVGGMEEALSRHADEVFHELPDDDHRAAAEKIFKALTERSTDNRGIRRPGQLRKLCAIAGTREATAVGVIEAFRKLGRTFLMPAEGVELQSEAVIDISHESLMRVWRRLDGWVEEESQSARIYRRLRETAELHREGRAGLYHDPDLQIAQSWREESQPSEAWAEQYGGEFASTMVFLDSSEVAARQEEREAERIRQRELEQVRDLAVQSEKLAQTQQRAARGFRRFAIGMGMVALMALAAFVFALNQRKRAEQSAVIAGEAEGVARDAEAAARKRQYMSDMSLVQQALAKSNTGRAKHLLDLHQPGPGESDLRGWEWRYLEAQTVGDEVARLGPFEQNIFAIDYSPDGRWLACTELGGPFSLWDTVTKQLVYRRSVGSPLFAFSPTENVVAVGADASSLLLLKIEEGTLPGEVLIPVDGYAGHLAFSPDGERLALFVFVSHGVPGWEVQVRDLDQGTQLLPAIKTSQDEASQHQRRVALSDDLLVIGDADGLVHVHSLPGGERRFSCEHPESITAVAISPDGNFLATGTGHVESDVRLWDLKTGALLHTLAGHLNWVSWLEFSPDGTSLASASADQTLRIWDLSDGHIGRSRVIRGNRDEVYTFALSPDATRLASGSKGGWIRFFDLGQLDARPTHREHSVLAGPGTERQLGTSMISFSRADHLLTAIDVDGQAVLFDAKDNLDKLRDLPALGTDLRGILFFPGGERLLATNGEGKLMVYDLATDQLVASKATGYAHFMPMGFSDDGLLATTGGTDGRKIILWDAATLEETDSYSRPKWQVRTLSSRGQFASFQGGATAPWVRLADTAAGPLSDAPFRELPTGGNRIVNDIAFSEDDRYLAASEWAGFVTVWDLHSRDSPPLRFKAQMMASYRTMFFQSNERLITLGTGRDLVKIWDRVSAQELLTFTGDGVAWEVRVSPDGATIAVVTSFRGDGHLHLWRAPSYQEIEQARNLVETYPVELSESLAIAERFAESAASGAFDRVQEQWDAIAALDPWPRDLDLPGLIDTYKSATLAEAERMQADGATAEAIALLRPIALFDAIGARSPNSLLGQLIEWEHPDDSPPLIAKGAKWKYLDDGSDQKTAWRDPDFDDDAWKEGPAKLGYADGARTEIASGTADTKHITSYFRHQFSVPETRQVGTLKIEVLRDDGLVLYLNGEELLRDNMRDGPITFVTPASRPVGEAEEERFFPFVIPATQLRPGGNVLAAEVHQINVVSSDLGFDLKLSALQHSPASSLRNMLADGGGAKLAETVRDRLPRTMRDAWMRDFRFVTQGEAGGDLHAIPDHLWVRRFEFCEGHKARLEIAQRRLELLEAEASPAPELTEAWDRRRRQAQAIME